MPRAKPKNTPVLTSLDEVDEILLELSGIDRAIEKIDTQASEGLVRIKKEAQEAVEPFLERQKLLQASLEQFAIHNKEEFKYVRSRKLRFGIIGFRKTSGKFKILAGWKWSEVTEKLITLKKKKYVRIKKNTDKEALEKDFRNKVLSHSDIESFGLKWFVDDEFYYETFQEDTPESPSA